LGGGADGVTSEVHRKILVQYGEQCMPWKNMREYVDRLKCQRTTHVEEQSGWLSTSQIDDHCTEMDALIKENGQITLSAVALNVAIMYGSAFDIVHDVLGYHKVNAGWVSQ